ncbi:MAG: helix-turn-helix domain-containing protein [Pseudomonas sp.]|nr:helix-turn-helix domain-containing protein [Pseudomonas sp.]
MVRYLVEEMDWAQPLFSQVPLARDLERTLIKGLILSQPNNYSEALKALGETRCPAFVLKARRFIEAQAENDLVLADIQQAAGVTPQRLHEGFKQHFGLSPIAYLKRFRLEAVRCSLLEDRGNYNIAATASRWGFAHLGRFAAQYQRAFGERPSQTLARARG